jgi:exonuclease VII small subunit
VSRFIYYSAECHYVECRGALNLAEKQVENALENKLQLALKQTENK